MKKTLLTFSVFLAVVCCTLAFAANSEGRWPLFENKGVTTQNEKSNAQITTPSAQVSTSLENKFSQEEITRVFSRCAESSRVQNGVIKLAAENDSTKTEELTVIDLWGNAPMIFPLNDDGIYDENTNTITFPGSEEQTNQIFAGTNESGSNYYWYAVANTNYVFSGTLTSECEANVYPGIVYRNTSEGQLYVSANTVVTLNEENNYTADFEVMSNTISAGSPLMVVFFVDGVSASSVDEEGASYPTITSTNNRFYYTVDAKRAEKWTSENTIAGLGFENLDKESCYTVLCNDGVTTLGLYYDGNLYITGINTSAQEVSLPNAVLINDNLCQIHSLGYYGEMDWSGAVSMTTLNMSSVSYVYINAISASITDLYIGANCSFDGYGDYSNVYLHIPYGESHDNYSWNGFKRVLVGEEQSYYPVSNNANWVIAGENEGEYFGISLISGYYRVIEIFTEGDSINLPIATPAAGGNYYIRYMGSDDEYNYGTLCKSAPNLKSVTVPATYTNVRTSWNNNPITDLHMLGDVPSTYWSLTSKMNVYVANQSYFSNYENNSNWNSASIIPEGWEFEWMTINVERKGEFAQTYIEMTDANWALGMYVKITGTLNTTDLQNISNLTSLRKLDLSEAEFASLPNSFLESKSNLMEVYLPDHLTSIPQYAFRFCSALSLVSAPGVTSIGSNAFYNCSKLSDFDISKVGVINQNAFYDCSQFNPTDLSSVYSIGSSAFYNTAIREAVIPDGVSTINSAVFSNCTRLSKVTLPNTITSIGNNAFNQCTALATINLPEGITSIGYDAFNNCTRIPEITLPSTLQSISYDIFDGCSSLTTVKCKAIVPPTTNGDFTYGVDLNHCSLYVAPFAIDAYRAAADWSNFYIMKPLNEPVKNIYINRPMTFDLLSEDNAVLQENPNMTLDYGTSSSYYYDNVGQLSASGDGTLSAGIFTIYHSFARRQSPSTTDYRTTLVNNAENMRADSVVCSISFEKNRWHFISFQYDVQMSDIFGLNNTDFVIRKYNSANRAMGDGTTSNWEAVPSDGVLEAGKGYIIQAANNTTNENGNSRLAVVRFPSRNTVTKNKLFTSNNVIVPLEEYPAEFAHNRSWNLVGNPYPCYYDMHYLMDDFTTPIVLWRGTSYQAYSPIDDDIILRPNEAFFVQRPLDAEQMVFGVEGRMHYSEAIYATEYNNSTPGIYYALTRSASDNQRSVFNFNIEGCGNNDRARVVLNEDASMEYEINRDASKFFAESCQGVEIYVDGDIKYDICERPLESGVVSLGTRIASDGVYSISLNGKNMEGWSVVLTDAKTGVSVNLMESAYEFDAEAGTDASRFLITFKAPGQSSIDEVFTSANNEIVRIVNISGINVYEGTLDNFTKSAPTGVYIVVTEDKTFKIVVK